MVRSMTGFGAASAEADGAQYFVEVRSVNNRFFKAQVRLPEELQGLETELESVLARKLVRGSVVLTVRFSDESADAAAHINAPALQRYLDQLQSIVGSDGITTSVDIASMLELPGVVTCGTGQERVDKARAMLLKLTGEGCDNVLVMRTREGTELHDDLQKHCEKIATHLRVVAERAPVVVDLYQQRLRQRITTMLAETGAAVRDEDLLREVAIYAERSDISEEVARLQGHINQFLEIIASEDGEPQGRTLDFLSQEMLREANTIGSKCLDVEVSRRIVEIKGGIDRLKEQAQNVQ